MFAAITICAVVVAIGASDQKPDEVRRILQVLPDIKPNDDLETVVKFLIRPMRKPYDHASGRPDTNPRYYFQIDKHYRLALDVTVTITNQPDGTKLIGNSVFDGAHIEKLTDSKMRKWKIIYPARTKSKMVNSGRK